MKSLLEVEKMLISLNGNNKTYRNLSVISDIECSRIEAWIEILNIILELYQENSEKDFSKLLLIHKDYLSSRCESDSSIYQKDITNGWIQSSIEAIDWFLN